jgi:hypothetical protein
MAGETTMMGRRAGVDHLVLVHRPVPIDSEEWKDFLDLAESIARSTGQVRVLVRTEDKGGPDASQRADLNERFEKLKIRVAVLTASRIARGIAMALQWFKIVDIKAVGPGEIDKALEFLETPKDERAEVIATLRQLEERMSLSGVG